VTRARVSGLPNSAAWALLARALLHERPVPGVSLPALKGPLVFVRADQAALEDAADAFTALEPIFGALPKPALFGEDAQDRLAALERLSSGSRLALATPETLATPAHSPAEYKSRGLTFTSGHRLPRGEALSALEKLGYRRVDFVESPGEYAVRGAVLDLFALEPLTAVRALYDEDTVQSLRRFDPTSQQTEEYLDHVKVGAAREPGVGEGTVLDWLEGATFVVEEGVKAALPEGAQVLDAVRLAEDGLDFGARPNAPVRGRVEAAIEEIQAAAAAGLKACLYSLNRGEDHRIQELFAGRVPDGACQFLIGPLRQGLTHPGLKIALFSTSEIFERAYRSTNRFARFTASSRAAFRFAELKQGDYVVHKDYGISRYRGLRPIESPGHGTVDCLKLEFRGSDTLYLPMSEFQKVQRFSGGEGHRPRLSSLDTRKWEEVKHLVAEGVRELAEALLKTHAERRAIPGYAFPPGGAIEREFAEGFPYEETPDQAKAIQDVVLDMEAPHPMDRLVVGDVGFGKTEVAMRAAFKCAAAGKQAALLVPTTILADQHFRTFQARFAEYPVKLAVLSRFQTPGEQKKILEALEKGKVDVVIGTARLLQKDVKFRDLGLAIIDEEHRFGVKDKEKFKQLRKSIDCLALSATPIPRSLNQAFSGLRGLSLIQSPPTGRQPIVTKVLPWSDQAVADAIREELAREGQVYYIHNRVRTLPEAVKTLEKLVPEARFTMVHGQMKGEEIETAMWDFFNRKYDVLAASTIIESGLDIPTVNTLIVEDAHEFGLAQLYQLRGRVGRERRRAYCWFFHPAGAESAPLTEEARLRLEALKEFAQLGAGMKLALRDLEIRGAGDLLGAKQHGFLNAVGVDYYTELLNEEIARRGGPAKAKEPERTVALDVRISAFIPEDYLPGEMERLEFYKRIVRAKPAEIPGLRKELEDLSGPIPKPVANLFDLLRVRCAAAAAGVKSVSQKGGEYELVLGPDAIVDPALMRKWTAEHKGKLSFFRGEGGDGVRVDAGQDAGLPWLERFLGEMVSSR
jgi:transcription-repair coupling factor (superfamily II helicase)